MIFSLIAADADIVPLVDLGELDKDYSTLTQV